MTSTPSSSEVKSPSFSLEQMSASQQQPFTLRLGTILTLPPPQTTPIANGTASSHIYPPPLNYSGQNLGAQGLHNMTKNPLQKYGYPIVDSFNYPSLAQPQGSHVSQKLPQLPQVSLQTLPQSGFPLSTQAFSTLNEKSLLQTYQPHHGFQPFASQNNQIPPQFSPQTLDAKSHTGNQHNLNHLPPEPAFTKQVRYSSSESEGEKSPHEKTHSHTPKFIHSKHSKAPKDIKLTRLKFTSAQTPEYKPFVCECEGCSWSFARKSDLRRHAKSHTPPGFHCPYWKNDPTCHRNGGSFSRLDVLKRHLRLVHYIKDKEKTQGAADPGWCRACQKLFPTSKSFIAHCDECASQVAPAEWKANTSPKQQTSVNDE